MSACACTIGFASKAFGASPNNGIANNARCAAANASSIASLVGIGKENWFGQALLGNDIAAASNLLLGPGRLSSAGQATLSSPLKYNAVNHIAGHFGAMDSGNGRWLNIGSVDEFGDPTAVFKGLSVAENAAGRGISEAVGVFTAAKLVFDTGAYAYAYAKCAGAIH